MEGIWPQHPRPAPPRLVCTQRRAPTSPAASWLWEPLGLPGPQVSPTISGYGRRAILQIERDAGQSVGRGKVPQGWLSLAGTRLRRMEVWGHHTEGWPHGWCALTAEWPAEPGLQAPGPAPSPWIYHSALSPVPAFFPLQGLIPLGWKPRCSVQANCSAPESPWIRICCVNQSVTHRQGLLAPPQDSEAPESRGKRWLPFPRPGPRGALCCISLMPGDAHSPSGAQSPASQLQRERPALYNRAEPPRWAAGKSTQHRSSLGRVSGEGASPAPRMHHPSPCCLQSLPLASTSGTHGPWPCSNGRTVWKPPG